MSTMSNAITVEACASELDHIGQRRAADRLWDLGAELRVQSHHEQAHLGRNEPRCPLCRLGNHERQR